MAEDAKYHPAREAAATAIGAAIGGRRCAWRCCGQVAEPGLLTRMSCPTGPRHVLPASGALPCAVRGCWPGLVSLGRPDRIAPYATTDALRPQP